MNYILYIESLNNLTYTVETQTRKKLFGWWYVIKKA